jgi:dihydroorotate dehydrogenase
VLFFAFRRALPGYPILATGLSINCPFSDFFQIRYITLGGIDSADSGMQFLYAGASALQVEKTCCL